MPHGAEEALGEDLGDDPGSKGRLHGDADLDHISSLEPAPTSPEEDLTSKASSDSDSIGAAPQESGAAACWRWCYRFSR